MVHRLSQMGRYTGTIRTGPGRYSLVIAVPKCTRSLYHFALYLAQIKNLMQLDSLCRFVSDEIVLFQFNYRCKSCFTCTAPSTNSLDNDVILLQFSNLTVVVIVFFDINILYLFFSVSLDFEFQTAKFD